MDFFRIPSFFPGCWAFLRQGTTGAGKLESPALCTPSREPADKVPVRFPSDSSTSIMWHEHDCHFIDGEVQRTYNYLLDWKLSWSFAMRAHSTIEARPSPRELCLPVFTVLARLQHPPVLNAQDSPFWYLLDLTDVGEEGRPQDPKGCYVSWKGEQQDSAANLAVLAHSYADCRLWRSAWVPTTNLDGEDLITVQGSNCGEAWQTLWTGHSTKTRHKTSHRHFTGRQTKQACT